VNEQRDSPQVVTRQVPLNSNRKTSRTCGFRLLRPDCPCCWQPTMRSPGSRACSFSACLGSATTRNHPPTRVYAGVCAAFPICPEGRRPGLGFRSSIPCPLIPLSTLRHAPRGAPRKTRGQVVRYSFPVGLFHSLLHAGLSRRTDRQPFRPRYTHGNGRTLRGRKGVCPLFTRL